MEPGRAENSAPTLSQFEEQRKHRQLSPLFLFLGVLCLAALGFWGTLGQLWLARQLKSLLLTPEPVGAWLGRSLEWSLWGAVAAIGLWALVAGTLFLTSARALPLAVGAPGGCWQGSGTASGDSRTLARVGG